MISNQLIHLRLSLRTGRRNETLLTCLKHLHSLWRAADVLNHVVQLASGAFLTPIGLLLLLERCVFQLVLEGIYVFAKQDRIDH